MLTSISLLENNSSSESRKSSYQNIIVSTSSGLANFDSACSCLEVPDSVFNKVTGRPATKVFKNKEYFQNR